jgi:hypothetical protein
MANRIVDNVYILDTASGNTALPWPSYTAKIQSVVFHAANSTGKLTLSRANTATEQIVKITCPDPAGNTVQQTFGGRQFSQLKLPVCTAGTGFIYFL